MRNPGQCARCGGGTGPRRRPAGCRCPIFAACASFDQYTDFEAAAKRSANASVFWNSAVRTGAASLCLMTSFSRTRSLDSGPLVVDPRPLGVVGAHAIVCGRRHSYGRGEPRRRRAHRVGAVLFRPPSIHVHGSGAVDPAGCFHVVTARHQTHGGCGSWRRHHPGRGDQFFRDRDQRRQPLALARRLHLSAIRIRETMLCRRRRLDVRPNIASRKIFQGAQSPACCC